MSIYALQSMVKGMNLVKTSRPTSTVVCKACTEGKQYATKLGNDEEMKVTKPLEIVHSDVCGPMENMYVGMVEYFITFFDDFFEEGVGLHDEIQRRVV